MNVKITKEQHERLCKSEYLEYEFGSRLFGTNRKDSDYDYMRIYKYNSVFKPVVKGLPSIHSFQYDDVENSSQYIWVTEEQFWANLMSGDGTIHSDILLFSKDSKLFNNKVMEMCRTYKIIRAYLGVVERDLKLHKTGNKLFHANRGLYIAECLINNKLPKKEIIQELAKNLESKEAVLEKTKINRKIASKMYENRELENYYIPDTEDDLLNIMLQANNIREFKYD